MRIAQVSPLFESVPPRLYGGTERVVSDLTEALVRLGHDVTLFASGDSVTSAKLVAPCPEGLRLSGCRDSLAPHLEQFEILRDHLEDFDVVHFHTDLMHLGLARSLETPYVFTLHGRLDLPEYRSLYTRFKDVPLTSISLDQRRPISFANWIGNVHHGLERDKIRYSPGGGEYLAFLGRISPEKGIEQAIEIARTTGHRLKVAAKIDAADREYHRRIEAKLSEPHVEFVGEISDAEKSQFLGHARALLFPIDWPEPFGLVMIESLAAGTPVVAFRRGSVPEVIRDGVTGYVVDDMTDAVEAVGKLDRIERAACRQQFSERFTNDRMAADYVEVYERLRLTHSHEMMIVKRGPYVRAFPPTEPRYIT